MRALQIFATLLGVVVLGGLTSCAQHSRTALAITDVEWTAPQELALATECATEVQAEVGADHSGTGLPEVTLWGVPTVGGCRPTATVELPARTTRIVDGTTSMVVDLPPPLG